MGTDKQSYLLWMVSISSTHFETNPVPTNPLANEPSEPVKATYTGLYYIAKTIWLCTSPRLFSVGWVAANTITSTDNNKGCYWKTPPNAS